MRMQEFFKGFFSIARWAFFYSSAYICGQNGWNFIKILSQMHPRTTMFLDSDDIFFVRCMRSLTAVFLCAHVRYLY